MVIECSGCRARYRMKESMLRGFAGAQVRCRKCGGTILVTTPKVPPESRTPATRKPLSADLPETATRPENVDPSSGGEEIAPVGLRAEAHKRTLETIPAPTAGIAEGTTATLPDNVFSLELRRGTRSKPMTSGILDISGQIRTEPAFSLPEQDPDPPPPDTEEAPENSSKPAPPTLFRGPVEWQKEGILSTARAVPVVSPGTEKAIVKSRSRRSSSRRFPRLPRSPRLSHIAIVYLSLLLAGGLAYLLLRLLAGMVLPQGE